MKEKRDKPFRWSPDQDVVIQENWPDTKNIVSIFEDEGVFVTTRQVYERGYKLGLPVKKLNVKKSKLTRVTSGGLYKEYDDQKDVIELLRRPWK